MQQRRFTQLLVQARKNKGLTQEEVCFLIGIAEPATLSRWENGRELPSERIVMKLVKAYDDPVLGYIYLSECTGLGKMILPPIVFGELDNLVLRLHNEIEDVVNMRRQMNHIARDKRVNEDEVEQWDCITKEIEELLAVMIPLRFEHFRTESKKLHQCRNIVGAII